MAFLFLLIAFLFSALTIDVAAQSTPVTLDAFMYHGKTYPAETVWEAVTSPKRVGPTTVISYITIQPSSVPDDPSMAVAASVLPLPAVPVPAPVPTESYFSPPAPAPIPASLLYPGGYDAPVAASSLPDPYASAVAAVSAAGPAADLPPTSPPETYGSNQYYPAAYPPSPPSFPGGSYNPANAVFTSSYQSSTTSVDHGSPTGLPLLDQEEVTCSLDGSNKVTISGIQGQWVQGLKDTLLTCHHALHDYDLHFAGLANSSQMVTFTVSDTEPRAACIETGIRVAGGALVPAGCQWGQLIASGGAQRSSTAGEPSPYTRPTVFVNWWQGMHDDNDHYGWGFWEIYGIRGWRVGDYATHTWPPLSAAAIVKALRKNLINCDHSVLMEFEHWRQANDTQGRPFVFFGLDIGGDADCFKEAVRKSGGPNAYEFGIVEQEHDGDWENWHKKNSPFKYAETLPQEDQVDGWPSVSVAENGYSETGEICWPGQGCTN